MERLSEKKTSRFMVLDMMKGFGIVAVVIAHSHSPLENYCAMFAISMFMMVSGFCWSEKHTQTWIDVWKLIKKRFKDLMIPYLVYSFAFLLLTDVFLAMHIYPKEYIGFGGFVSVIFGLVGSVFAATLWYFYQLFLVYIIHAVICRLFCKFIITERRRLIFYIVLTAVSIIILKMLHLHRDQMSIRLLIRLAACYVAFVMGIPMRILHDKLNMSGIHVFHMVLFIAAGVLIYIINTFTLIDVAAGNITAVWSYVVCGILGFIFIFCLSVILDNKRTKRLADVMSYLGQNTKPIMVFHYIFFKPVTLVYILICGLPIAQLEIFPLIQDENLAWMWIFYVISGVVFSLLADKFLSALKACIIRRS